MSRGLRLRGLGCLGLVLALSGCAWFQAPAGPVGAPAPPPVGDPLSPEAAAELLRQADADSADGQAPGDSLAAPDSLAAAPAPPDSLDQDLPEDVVSGSDAWDLAGGNLTATTGPGGQVLLITEPVITHRDLTVTARRGEYLVDLREARLQDGVHYREPDFSGYSDRALYYRDTELMVASGNVTLEGDSLRIATDVVRYDRRTGRAVLTGGVDGTRGGRRLIAQRGEWDRNADTLTLIGGVIVTDPANGSTVTGNHLVYDLATDRAQVSEQPALDLTSTQDGRIRIRGDRMWVAGERVIHAAGNVTVVRGGITAFADSAAYFDSLGVARLLGSPRVEERDGIMEGDTLSLFFDADRSMNRAEMHGHASMVYTPKDSVKAGERSTVRGDHLTLEFGPLRAERVVVFGNATSEYRPSPADSSSGAGVNSARGDSITIQLGDDGVETVRVAGNAEGVYRFVNRKGGSPADTSAREETVSYGAREVLYSLADRTVDLEGDARLEYGTLNLTAGKVKFFADSRYLEAEDEPTLVDSSGGGQQVTGEHMDYSLESQEGNIDGGLTRAEDGFISSDRLRKIGDTQFIARGGSYTTCDLAGEGKDPHFRFQSSRMRIYLEDKVVARPVTLYIRDVPVFMVPFYVFSIRRGRQSGFLTPSLDFGFGSTGPGFSNLGYYWATNEYADLTGWVDYRSDRDVLTGWLRGNYAVRYLMNGTVQVGRTFGNSSARLDVTGAHTMSLGSWRLTGRAEFRDRDFRSQQPLDTDFGNRVDRILDSNLSLTRNFSRASFSLSVSRREDLAATPSDLADEVILTETLPAYRFSLTPLPIGRRPDADGTGGRLAFLSNLRLGFSSSGGTSRTVTEKTTILAADSLAALWDRALHTGAAAETLFAEVENRSSSASHTATLSDTRKLGYLNVTPQLTLTDQMVDREFSAADTVKGFRNAVTWRGSLSATTQLFGDFGGVGPVERFRHTFRPGASFSFSPDFDGLSYVDTQGVRRSRFPGVSTSRSRVLGLSMTHGLQGKVRSGDGVKPVNFLTWSTSTSYDFLAEQEGRLPWSDLRSQFDFASIRGVNLNFNSVHDPYNQFRFRSFNSSAFFGLSGRLPGAGGTQAPTSRSYSEEEQWRSLGADVGSSRGLGGSRTGGGDALTWDARFGFSFDGSRDLAEDFRTSARLTTDVGFQVTANWFLSYTNQWDITRGDVTAESISLKRDLHCWEAEFRRNRLGDDTTFWFRINIKTLPEVRYEQGPAGGTGLSGLTNALP